MDNAQELLANVPDFDSSEMVIPVPPAGTYIGTVISISLRQGNESIPNTRLSLTLKYEGNADAVASDGTTLVDACGPEFFDLMLPHPDEDAERKRWTDQGIVQFAAGMGLTNLTKEVLLALVADNPYKDKYVTWKVTTVDKDGITYRNIRNLKLCPVQQEEPAQAVQTQAVQTQTTGPDPTAQATQTTTLVPNQFTTQG